MATFIRLSYDIEKSAPGWPGNPTYSYHQCSALEQGDIANTYELHLFDHFGTHLDAPNHFNPNGIKIAQVPIDRFIYERPLLIDLEKADRELVMREELEPYADRLASSDAVLLRSGWSKIRGSEPERYAAEGPGISPDACEYLLSSFPSLKAIGMDWISLAAYRRLDEGILAHQILCGVHHPDRYMIIIEDLILDEAPDRMNRLYAIPLFPEGVDSSPCTVIVEVG